MWNVIKYTLIHLFSSTWGTVTGMGGGVVVKPIMDLLGDYDMPTVGIMTSASVFAMSIVAVLFLMRNKSEVSLSLKNASVLAVASAGGGLLGQMLFSLATDGLNDVLVKMIQNILLVLLLALIFLYMMFKGRIKGFHLQNIFAYAVVGVFLGILATFLGIGGGPINVAVLILLFGMSTKNAILYSLISILFSQSAKLISIFFTTGYGVYDLSILPYLLAASVLGAVIGSLIQRRLSQKKLDILFNCMVIAVAGLALYNVTATLI